MQKSDLKDFWFYQYLDGSPDELALQLNCFEASVYHVIKNSSKLDRNLIVPLFIRDINPTLWYNNTTGIFRIYNLSRNINPLWMKYLNINQYVKIQDNDSVHFLESLLDKGKMVILQTVFERVRFYHKYSPEYDLNTYHQGVENHVNVTLYHEDDKIYFAEKIPYTINKDYYVPYEFNRQIGVTQKSEIEEACKFFMRCHTIDVNEPELRKTSFKKDIADLIHSIADNYIGGVVQDGLYTRYSGVKALGKFAEFCDEGYSFKNYYITEGWSMWERVSFDMWMLYGSRTILLDYLRSENSETEGSEVLKQLIEIIIEARAQWIVIERMMIKQLQSNSSKLNAKIGNRVRQLIVLEDKLNLLLKNYL